MLEHKASCLCVDIIKLCAFCHGAGQLHSKSPNVPTPEKNDAGGSLCVKGWRLDFRFRGRRKARVLPHCNIHYQLQ
jgi:hypothetical protein